MRDDEENEKHDEGGKYLQLRTAINVHKVQHHDVNKIRYEELIDENIYEKLREDLKQ